MQRYGEIERQSFVRKAFHGGNQTAGGKADVADTHAEAPFRRGVAQKTHDGVVIVEGFAAAHEHDVFHRSFFARAALQAVDG